MGTNVGPRYIAAVTIETNPRENDTCLDDAADDSTRARGHIRSDHMSRLPRSLLLLVGVLLVGTHGLIHTARIRAPLHTAPCRPTLSVSRPAAMEWLSNRTAVLAKRGADAKALTYFRWASMGAGFAIIAPSAIAILTGLTLGLMMNGMIVMLLAALAIYKLDGARELRELGAYLRRPTLSPRAAGRVRGSGLKAELFSGLLSSRLLCLSALGYVGSLPFALAIQLALLTSDFKAENLVGKIIDTAVDASSQTSRLQIPLIAVMIPAKEELTDRLKLRIPLLALFGMYSRLARQGLPRLPASWCIPKIPNQYDHVLAFSMLPTIEVTSLGIAWLSFAGLAPRTARRVRRRWHRIYRRVFPAFFYVVAALFAWEHVANVRPVDPKVAIPLWFKCLSVLPQAWMGLVFGYARMRHGIGAAIGVHVLHNTATIASSKLFPLLGKETMLRLIKLSEAYAVAR